MFSFTRTLLLVLVLVVVGEPRCCLRVVAAQSNQGAAMQIPKQIPDSQLPLAAEDRRIDLLGAEANIHSVADAEAYVEAIIKRRHGDAVSSPELSALVHRLALAEYASLTDPQKRISDSQIASTFNAMMNEWGAAQWTRLTAEDFHRFHKIKAGTLIPYSVSRDADGKVSDTCRPAEAFYLLDVLSIERGLQYSQAMPDLPDASIAGPAVVNADYSWQPDKRNDDKTVFSHYEEYLKTRNAWLQSHFNSNPAREIGHLLDILHIS